MSFHRAERVADQIQREVSMLLLTEVKDPRIGMVTISRVEVTHDLALARIYFTRMGSEEERDACWTGLDRASGFIRRRLGQALTLRSVPEIEFRFDRSLDHVDRVNELLRSIHDEGGSTSSPEGAAGEPEAG